MATIDIREDDVVTVDEIIFAGDNPSFDNVTNISPTFCYSYSSVVLSDKLGNYSIKVVGKDIPNLIKALQKAIDLGWTK